MGNVNAAKKKTSGEEVKEFFEKNGLTVIDSRSNNGILWVLGGEGEIGRIVDKACEKYGISGAYSAGKQTGFKPGWYTKIGK